MYYIQVDENGFIGSIVSADEAPNFNGTQLSFESNPAALSGKYYVDGKFYEPKVIPDLDREIVL
jgi:hypothetical protein